MTLANRITLLRVILVPVFVVLFLQERYYPQLHNWTLAVFALAIFTDLLDGLAARLRGERTPLGTFLDPMADKLLITSTYILFVYVERIDLWIFVTIFSRDLLIVMGWAIVHILSGSSKITPRPLGKASTLMQMCAAITLLYPVPDLITLWTVRAMVALTVISAIDYILLGSKQLEPIPENGN